MTKTTDKKQNGQMQPEVPERVTADQSGNHLREANRVIHDLQTYQAEMEVQNAELREAQEQLGLTKERYVRLFEEAPVGYLLVDRHGLVQDANVAALELLGVQKASILRRSLANQVVSEDLPVYLFHQMLSMEEPERVQYEIRVKRPDGTIRYLLVTSQRKGEAVFRKDGVLVTLVDITRLKEAERALQKGKSELEQRQMRMAAELDRSSRTLSEETEERVKTALALEMTEKKHRMMINNINEGVVVIQDFKLVFVNRMVLDVTGQRAETLIGLPFLTFVHADDREMVAARHKARLTGQSPPELYDLRIFDKAGRPRWMRINSKLIDWEGRPAVLSTLVDVTERKEIEERLEREHRTLATILDNIPVMIMMYDQEGKVALVNPEFEAVLGWTAQDFAQGHMQEACCPDPEYRHRVWEFMLSSSDQWMDIDITTKAGTVLPSSWSSVSLPTGMQIGIGIDIRERLEMERKLADERERLQRVLDSIPVMITLHDAEGGIQYVNPEYENALGWTKADMERYDNFQLRFPDPEDRRKFTEFKSSGTSQWGDFEVSTKWGPTISSSWTHVKLRDGSVIGIGINIQERKRSERALLEAYGQLGIERTTLEKKNVALREVLAQFDSKKKEIKEIIASNIGDSVIPSLERAKEQSTSEAVRRSIDIVEQELKEIASPLIPRIKAQFGELTAREQEVVRLLRQGMDTRQVAEALGLSKPTVQKYRELIRKKLELTGQQVNLKSFLRNIDQEK